MKAPSNTRVQRTRSSPSALRLPLTRRPLGSAKWHAAVAACLALTSQSLAQGSEKPTAAQVSGCYQLQIGAWQPALKLDRDVEFITPPDRVNLKLDAAEHSWRKVGLLVRQAPGSRGSIHTSGEWSVSKNVRVEILWSTGFSGLTMELANAPGGLHGSAKTFWDFPRPTQRATVEAKRVSCSE